ncbi:MAG: hypothetical protein CVU44_09135 [Chloroflexi bacterium HGW-Chloroflexi-6]|nr:MAG: hypothetical protein CVU44_09135 [Chloroflexi bacterium HGW-Chloroflexi-6]
MEPILNFFKERPAIAAIITFAVGLLLGLLLAWYPFAVTWIDQPVDNLRADLRMEYMSMTVDSFRVNGDLTLATKRYNDLGAFAFQTFQDLKANPGKVDPVLLQIFETQMTDAGVMKPTGDAPTPTTPGFSLGTALLWGAVIALLLVGLGAGFYLFRGGTRRSGAPLTAAQQAADMSRSVEKTDYSAVASTPPVAQYVTTYVLGDDLFDDSFSIDSQAGEFLGECGVGISETIGVGDPKKVTAFEVWMFDKNDIQTVTKVLMSPHAFNDPSFRTKLESKGEMFLVEPHKQMMLETQTLQMVVTVVDSQFGQGALPSNSYFDRITLELAIWSK